MIKKIPKILAVFIILASFTNLKAQLTHEYKESFTGGSTYCPASTQYDNWGKLRAKLDTGIYKYTKVIMKGNFNATAVTGRTCSDFDKVRQIANAMKNKVNFSVTCNGNVWRVTTNNCIVIGGCVVAADDVELSADGTACSCTNPSWSLRPIIGNRNWGGVGGAGCGGATQIVQLTFEYPGPFNNMHVAMEDPGKCDYTQDLKAKFTNGSLKKVDSFIYHYKVGNTVFGPFKILSNLAPLKDTTITIKTGHTFTAQTAYNFTTFITKVNTTPDSSNFGDTSRVSGFFSGNPGIPTAFDAVICGSGKTLLKCLPNNPGDSITWYSDKAASQLVGPGKNTLSPFLNSGQTYLFWAYPSSGIVNNKLTVPGGNYVGTGGQMFDLQVLNSMSIDSLDLHINSFNSESYEIYIRDGSYTDAGATTTSSMWTLAKSGTVTGKGYTNRTPVPFIYNLSAGKTYGVYITLSSSTNLVFSLNNSSISNSDVILTAGSSLNHSFSNPIANRTWNGTIYYKKALCTGPGDSAIVEVRPKPWGASLDETVGFQKAPKKGGLGIKSSPHVVALGDTLKYDFTNPTGFTTADLGTTWTIDNVSVMTESGRDVSAQSTWAVPTGTTAGRFAYSPDTATVDSNVLACITFSNSSTTCDSTVCTYIYVAPLPDPSYTRAQKICDGDVIAFTNTSTIQSGFMNHKWYFGDGDSTDAPDPVKQYATNGTYYLTYNAISSIYGYIRTVLDTVEVTQIPQVAFGIANVCEGQTHTFTNNTTVAAGVLSYMWNYGDGNTSTNANMVHTHSYPSKGRYSVTLSAEANGCAATLTKNAYSFPNPVADITAPATGLLCSNKPVTFGNNSTISSGSFGHIWRMGDSKVQTTKNPMYQYAGPGTYRVNYIARSEFGCEGKDSVDVTILTSPTVDFTVGQACDLEPTEFKDITSGIGTTNPTYAWNLGDGNTSGAKDPSYQYASIGPKTVTLKVVLDNGCEDEASKTIEVKTQPNVDFAVADGCFGKAIPFDNKTTSSSGTINYKWQFGNGDSSVLADPEYTYNGTATQTYNVTLKADVNGACQSQVIKTVQVYELPLCSFTVSSGWTPGFGFRTINLAAANTTYPYYKYSISDGGSVNTATGSYQFQTDGIYDITLTARNAAGCECSSTQKRYQQNSLNTNNLDGDNIDIFPNPSTGLINVTAQSTIKTVKVYDVLGNVVLIKDGAGTSKFSFNLGVKSNGIYLVKVITNGGTLTKRIVLNK